MVECDLAKVEVAGSNPVSRSSLRSRQACIPTPASLRAVDRGIIRGRAFSFDLSIPTGAVAKW